MRNPHPRRPHPIFGALGFALALLLTTSARAQETSPDASSPARYIPKDGLGIYIEYRGVDAQADAWKKTSAYKILNATPTGAMLEDVAHQLIEKYTTKPDKAKTADQLLAIFKHLVKSGFVIAGFNHPEDPTKPAFTLILRDAFKDKDARAFMAGWLQNLNAPGTKPQSVIRGGHKVITGTTGQAKKFTWWVDDSKKEDIILMFDKPEVADVVLETLDGKRPSAVGHPKRVELIKQEGQFVPNGLLFLTPVMFEGDKNAAQVGLGNVKSIDFRWGFQDEALVTSTRISTSGPRTGFLTLLDGTSFDKSKLPLVPDGVTGFTAASVDLAATVDKLVNAIKPFDPAFEEKYKEMVDSFKEKTKLKLKEDLLAHLGPKMSWFTLPATKKAAGPAGLAGMMAMGGMEIPRFAIVIDVDNPTAFGKALDQAMVALNRELKAMGKPPAAAPPAKGARNKAAGPAGKDQTDGFFDVPPKGARAKAAAPSGGSFEFRSNPGDTKSYTLQVPPELSAQIPSTIRPTIRVGAKQVVIAISPEVARAVLEAKGTWTPPADLAAAYEALPGNLKMVSVSDPREVWPTLLSTLPGKIQALAGIRAIFQNAQARAANPAQPPPAPAPLVLQVDPAKLPSADAIKALMFPSLVSMESTPEEFRITTRDAFPPFPDPSSASIATALLLPAVQAAREAARKAQEHNRNLQLNAPPAGASPATPPATPPAAPPAAQPGRPAPGRPGTGSANGPS